MYDMEIKNDKNARRKNREMSVAKEFHLLSGSLLTTPMSTIDSELLKNTARTA